METAVLVVARSAILVEHHPLAMLARPLDLVSVCPQDRSEGSVPYVLSDFALLQPLAIHRLGPRLE